MEPGAQDVSADPFAAAKMLSDFGFKNSGQSTRPSNFITVRDSQGNATDINGGPGNVHAS
jgi:hypothetical protein